jgi:single-stranded-DNA-specific exonuclease
LNSQWKTKQILNEFLKHNMQKRWGIKDIPNTETWSKLQQELSIEKPLAMLLAQRGIETFDQAQAFFRPKLEELHDPFLMKDMDKAVTRIEKAIANGETSKSDY